MAKNCQLILLPLLFVLSLLLSPAASQAGDVTPQIAFARDGNSVIATVYARIPDGYHAYAHTPGDAGRPTTLDFFLADGVPVTVYYPKGSLQRDYYDSSATVNVYDGELNLFMLLPSDSPGKPYRASLQLKQLRACGQKLQRHHSQKHSPHRRHVLGGKVEEGRSNGRTGFLKGNRRSSGRTSFHARGS